jgi:hypothetical protein
MVRPKGVYSLLVASRFYYIFKIVSLVVAILSFIVASTKNSDEIGSLVFSTLISIYVIWCIGSLHEALMTGGKTAEDAGFNVVEVTCTPFPLRVSQWMTTRSLSQAGE